MSSRMRHTRSKTRSKRSHNALEETRLSTCSECGSKYKRHTICMECGTYRGKKFIDVEAIKEKKRERRENKLRRMGEEVEKEAEQAEASDKQEKGTPLDPNELSKK